ncbi:MAG TPA: aminotransferase class III-fold pyridoxal phosphate-dependent enzyme, partial [Hyphomicrobiaceae bacterium]|nr:aminotransferase class III-fold pyridoxal phosphate-dependent enzyme [Hyphomicrobiaceae bacterium]
VLGGPNIYEARLAELMCARFPAVELVRFCNSGSEATLLCVSLARAITGRETVMVMNGAYHGSFLSFPSGKPAHLNAPFPIVTVDYNDPNAASAAIRSAGDRLACVILEPLMGSGGCIPATPEFLATLRRETEAVGAGLIFDEVMTSRLAPGGLHGALGLKPDIVAFGKYLGGGLTFGAFGGRRDWMARLDPSRADVIVHSGTYNNNVLTMAAGIAGLETVFTPAAAARLNQSGDRLRARLNAAAEARGLPVRATGSGSMINIHPTARALARPADHAHVPADARKLLHLEFNLAGQYVARRGFMALSLPLTDADHDALVTAFEAILDAHAGVLAALES